MENAKVFEVTVKSRLKKMKRTVMWLAVVGAFLCGGCQLGRVVGVLGSPTSAEQKIPAEYDLAKQTEKKVLVLVEQPAWLGSDVNLRYYLTDALRKNLSKTMKFPEEHLISYDKLSELRSSRSDFSSLLPAEVGKALNAEIRAASPNVR